MHTEDQLKEIRDTYCKYKCKSTYQCDLCQVDDFIEELVQLNILENQGKGEIDK